MVRRLWSAGHECLRYFLIDKNQDLCQCFSEDLPKKQYNGIPLYGHPLNMDTCFLKTHTYNRHPLIMVTHLLKKVSFVSGKSSCVFFCIISLNTDTSLGFNMDNRNLPVTLVAHSHRKLTALSTAWLILFCYQYSRIIVWDVWQQSFFQCLTLVNLRIRHLTTWMRVRFLFSHLSWVSFLL